MSNPMQQAMAQREYLRLPWLQSYLPNHLCRRRYRPDDHATAWRRGTTAIKPAIGFLRPLGFIENELRRSYFALPAISPNHDDDWVSGRQEHFQHSRCTLYLHRVAPLPTAVVWPRPALEVWNTAHRSMCRARYDADIALFGDGSGHNPILHSSGVKTPGSLPDQARLRALQPL